MGSTRVEKEVKVGDPQLLCGSRFATWTNGAAQPQDMAQLVAGVGGPGQLLGFGAAQREAHLETEAA